MANPYFQFKQFTVRHDRCAMKVTTDACLFGAWCAAELQAKPIRNMLDIGAGSGLLSLMVAQKNKVAIDAVEIEFEASAQAMENAQASTWSHNIRIVHKDILDFNEKKYDCVISNPPFYENELKSDEVNKNIAHHSEHLSIKQVIDVVKASLEENGSFFLLLPFKRGAEIRNLLAASKLFPNKMIMVCPSPSLAPTRLMISGTHASGVEETEMMFIKKSDGQYSDRFVQLLKDYYLYL